MSELFDEDTEEKELVTEDEVIEDVEDVVVQESSRQRPGSDARRRLEKLLEEKRLQDELEDFLDY